MKTLKSYEFNGFGFPVVLESVPAIEIDGELMPKVNWTKIGFLVLIELCRKQRGALTGNQIRFIRTQFDMTMREFAKWIGVVHGSVSEWEKRAERKAQIEPHTEFAIRMQSIVKAEQSIEKDNMKLISLVDVVTNVDWQLIKKTSTEGQTPIVQLDEFHNVVVG